MKTIINCFLAVALFAVAPFVQAQDADEPPHMWENLLITPDNQHLKTLQDNMRKHNQKYHASGSDHQVVVFNIQTGPDVGKIIWSMGPIKYASLDSRPAEGGHDEDWRDNVMPYIKKMNNAEYWTMDTKISNTEAIRGKLAEYPLLYVRYHTIEEGQGYQMKGLFEKMTETVKSMEGLNPFGIYYNDFRQGNENGRHVAAVNFLKNWGELDGNWDFKGAFIKKYGENEWRPWTDGMDDMIQNSWDELWMYDKYMSGH